MDKIVFKPAQGLFQLYVRLAVAAFAVCWLVPSRFMTGAQPYLPLYLAAGVLLLLAALPLALMRGKVRSITFGEGVVVERYLYPPVIAAYADVRWYGSGRMEIGRLGVRPAAYNGTGGLNEVMDWLARQGRISKLPRTALQGRRENATVALAAAGGVLGFVAFVYMAVVLRPDVRMLAFTIAFGAAIVPCAALAVVELLQSVECKEELERGIDYE